MQQPQIQAKVIDCVSKNVSYFGNSHHNYTVVNVS